MSKLTPTAYALLALLNLKPWSAYDLTHFMRMSNLRAIWPRAESRLYAEPKNLLALGLINAKTEQNAGRKRTVYEINAKGRRALQAWLRQPAEKRFIYESEAMLKVAHGDMESLEVLKSHVAAIREEADNDFAIMQDVFEQIVKHDLFFPERLHINALTAQFVFDMIEARLRWVGFAEQFIAKWKDTKTDDAKEAQSLDWYRVALDRIKKLR